MYIPWIRYGYNMVINLIWFDIFLWLWTKKRLFSMLRVAWYHRSTRRSVPSLTSTVLVTKDASTAYNQYVSVSWSMIGLTVLLLQFFGQHSDEALFVLLVAQELVFFCCAHVLCKCDSGTSFTLGPFLVIYILCGCAFISVECDYGFTILPHDILCIRIEYILVDSSTGPWDALHQCSTVQDILDISGYLWDVGLACVVLAAWAMHQKELVGDCIAHTWRLIQVHLKSVRQWWVSGRELWVNLDFISVDLDWWLRVEGYSLFFLLECILCSCLPIDGLQDCGSNILCCIYVDRSMCMDPSDYIPHENLLVY